MISNTEQDYLKNLEATTKAFYCDRPVLVAYMEQKEDGTQYHTSRVSLHNMGSPESFSFIRLLGVQCLAFAYSCSPDAFDAFQRELQLAAEQLAEKYHV